MRHSDPLRLLREEVTNTLPEFNHLLALEKFDHAEGHPDDINMRFPRLFVKRVPAEHAHVEETTGK